MADFAGKTSFILPEKVCHFDTIPLYRSMQKVSAAAFQKNTYTLLEVCFPGAVRRCLALRVSLCAVLSLPVILSSCCRCLARLILSRRWRLRIGDGSHHAGASDRPQDLAPEPSAAAGCVYNIPVAAPLPDRIGRRLSRHSLRNNCEPFQLLRV